MAYVNFSERQQRANHPRLADKAGGETARGEKDGDDSDRSIGAYRLAPSPWARGLSAAGCGAEAATSTSLSRPFVRQSSAESH